MPAQEHLPSDARPHLADGGPQAILVGSGLSGRRRPKPSLLPEWEIEPEHGPSEVNQTCGEIHQQSGAAVCTGAVGKDKSGDCLAMWLVQVAHNWRVIQWLYFHRSLHPYLVFEYHASSSSRNNSREEEDRI
jgi:hypothetical protein